MSATRDGQCAHCGQPAEMCIDCGVLLTVFESERRLAEEIIRNLLDWQTDSSEGEAARAAARAYLGIEP